MKDTKNHPESTVPSNQASEAGDDKAALENDAAAGDDAPENHRDSSNVSQTSTDAERPDIAENSTPDPVATSDAQQPDSTNDQEAGGDEAPSLEDQIAELRDRLLRAMAELENNRKRSQRDREEASKYAITGFARGVLTVADNLRRAIESVADTERENETIKTLLDGVELTERELLKVFEREGIKSIDPLGEKFDHNFHQAMFEVESSNQPNGTVVQVIEPGYLIADRLLRAAMVGIAKTAPTGERDGEINPGSDT